MPVQGAGLGQDLAAVGTDDPVDAVKLLDVSVKVDQSGLVAAQGAAFGRGDRVEKVARAQKFAFFAAVVFLVKFLQKKKFRL